VLRDIAEEETELREAAVRGRSFDHGSWSGHIPAEKCAEELYERQPVFALVREWCGQPAVDRFDEVAALRVEISGSRGL